MFSFTDSEMPRKLTSATTMMKTKATGTIGRSANSAK